MKVKDKSGLEWDVVLKSWANGPGHHRRVYALDHVLEYLTKYNLRESDCIGLCTDPDGNIILDHNTEQVLPLVDVRTLSMLAPT
jgi:hypothetical protein